MGSGRTDKYQVGVSGRWWLELLRCECVRMWNKHGAPSSLLLCQHLVDKVQKQLKKRHLKFFKEIFMLPPHELFLAYQFFIYLLCNLHIFTSHFKHLNFPPFSSLFNHLSLFDSFLICSPTSNPLFPLLSMLHRPYWRCYYSNTDAVIYVVDSSDRDRMGISKSELVAMLEVSGAVGMFITSLIPTKLKDWCCQLIQ